MIRTITIFLFAFFLFMQGKSTIAQQYQFEDIAKAFQYGNFKKCYKLADKGLKSHPDESLLYVYKAISIYEGRNQKLFLKLYPDPLNESVTLLKKAKETINAKDQVPPTFLVSLKNIQNEVIRPIKSAIKKREVSTANKLLKEFTTLFDNSHVLYENQSAHILLTHCRKTIVDSKKKHIEPILHLAYSIAQNEIASLIKVQPSNTINYRLAQVQKNIYDQILSLYQLKQIDYIAKWEQLPMEFFDNSTEQKRNYYTWDISALKQENLPKEALLKTKLFSNLKTDRKKLTDKEYLFDEWKDPIYFLANTGENADYLSQLEKNVLYIMNLCRMQPKLFEVTFLKKYIIENPDEKGSYASSLKRTLKSMDPLYPFQPDSLISLAAQIHAEDYGKKGKEGHGGLFGGPRGRMDHFGAPGNLWAECCDYGMEKATEIVLHLLVDNGIAGVGHRKTLLDKELRRAGIAIEPHKQYDVNCVIDFMD